MVAPNLDIPHDRLAEFCRKWRIARLEVFGSAVRDDFGPESDVDVLVTFKPEAEWSMFDVLAARRELAEMLGRPADLIERPTIEKHHNPWLRHEILREARVVYSAA